MSERATSVVVASSKLAVRVSNDPWHLVVSDTAGRPILEESSPAGAGGPVGLGFQAGDDAPRRRWRKGPSRQLPGPDNEIPPGTGGWWRAMRTSSERSPTPFSYEALLETNDPSGRRMSLSIELLDEFTLSVRTGVVGATEDIEAVGHAYKTCERERFLGFGERSHAASVDLGVIENYVGEGPYQPHEYPFLESTIPPWGIRQRLDASYFPIPWILSTCGWGICIDDDEISYFRIRTVTNEAWNLEVESTGIHYRIFCGRNPLEALELFTAATGRQPEPQPWFFGPWYQTGHSNHVPIEEEQRQLSILRAANAPVSAAETHCRYLPLGEDQGCEEEEAARTAFFHAEGLAAVSYLNPLVGAEYEDAWREAVARDALQRRADNEPYSFEAYAGGRVPPHTLEAQYDFTTDGAASCFKAIAQKIALAGYDGWMEDFGEYTPLDSLQSNGGTGTAVHNRYPTDYHSVASMVTAELEADHGRRFARFVRSGWRGTAKIVPIVWGGDPTTSWGFDGLASAVVEGLSAGASGVAMWGSDIGGFLSTDDRLTPELLRRWIQFAALTPVMRTKAGGIELPPYDRPQIWDADIVPVWRRWASLHTQLNDYLTVAHDAYRRSGRPIMASLELVYPDEPLLAGIDDEYLFGEDLLVAPVIEPNCASRSVAFPSGKWIDLWSAVSFDDASRRFVMNGERQVVEYLGPVRTEVAVTDDEIPVFVRSGSVINLLSAEVDTLSPYGGAAAVTGASERDHQRQLLAFPEGLWERPVGPGQHARSELRLHDWILDVTSDRHRTWELSAFLGTAGVPGSVTVDGGLTPNAWSYDGTARIFTCQFPGAVTHLRVELT